MKIIPTDILLAFGTAAALLISTFGAFSQKCESLQDEVLRLHIPANSNSDADQKLKLLLRDYLLEKYGKTLSSAENLAAAENEISALLPEIRRDCNAFLSENGADYSADAQLVNMYFTTRVYEDIIMPAGNYDALRVTLGSGDGQNWWCIMFPPLCLPAVSNNENGEPCPKDIESALSAVQPADEGALYCDTEYGRIEFKFAIYEFFKWILG